MIPFQGPHLEVGGKKFHQGASNHDSLKDSLARASFCQSQRFDRQKRPKAIYEGVQSNGAHPGEVFSVRFNDSKKSQQIGIGNSIIRAVKTKKIPANILGSKKGFILSRIVEIIRSYN